MGDLLFHSSSWLPEALELLRSPAGALLFIPLYALWVTLLLPGVGPSCGLGCSPRWLWFGW